MKVILVRVKYRHHSKFSGYDVIFNKLQGKEFVSVYFHFRFILLKKIINRLLSMVFKRFFNADYRFDQFLHELDIAWAIIRHKPTVVHVTHAHDQFKVISKKFFRNRTQFVGSVHLPYVMFKTGKKKLQWLDFYDRVMVLDDYSTEMFGKHFGEKVVFTPHPVDTDYFSLKRNFNNNERPAIFNCVFLGRFMRNIEMVLDTIIAVHKKDPSIHFYFSHPMITGLGDQFYYKMLGALSLPTVHYNSKVSDAVMLDYYQQHHVLLMPMFESTANNVFLEAAACGMPVIGTYTNGLSGYLPELIRERYNSFTTVDELVEEILKLRNDASYYNQVCKAFYDFTIANFTINQGLEVPMKIYRQEI